MAMRLKSLLWACAMGVGTGLAAPATAQDVAVVLAQGQYDVLPTPEGSREVARLRESLRDAGFEVIALSNRDADSFAQSWRDLAARVARAERLVIVTRGHVVATPDGDRAWVLLRNADAPDPVTAGFQGISVAALMDLAAAAPGASVVAIGDPEDRIELGRGLTDRWQPSDVPSGLALVTGRPAQLADFLRLDVVEAGRRLDTALLAAPAGIRGYGSANRTGLLADPGAWDRAAWSLAQAADTVEAYDRYLDRFPDGLRAADARARISALSETPAERAERLEAELGLSRDNRRTIQQALTLLGYDTRGVDGIFGRGTRAAIGSWQRANGLQDTGYLTGNQISRLEGQARARAAEIEEEERRAAEARLAADRAYWAQVARGRGEPGLRAYLARYPEGFYADVARDRLRSLEAERVEVARREERALWQTVLALGTIEAIRRYLDRHPDGAFQAEARDRLAALERESVETRRRAWRRAADIDSIPAYRAFLREYPNGQFAQEARARIQQLEARNVAYAEQVRLWEQTTARNTEAAYRRFLDRYPNGQFAAEARTRIARLQERAAEAQAEGEIWRDARQSNSIAAYQRYLDRFPSGQFAGEARARIKQLQEANRVSTADRDAWRRALTAGTAVAFQRYLEAFPRGAFVRDAQDKLVALGNARRETALAEERVFWRDVQRNDSAQAYRRYLERYPNGQFAASARQRIAQLERPAPQGGGQQPGPLWQQAEREEKQIIAQQPRTVRLATQRLSQLGFKIGPLNNTLEEADRRALRQFQSRQGLTVTGLLTIETRNRLFGG